MKAVVGVDVAGLYEPALNLLGRLAFPSVELNLIHADVPIGMETPQSFVWTPEVFAIQNDIDDRILLDAQEAAARNGLTTTKSEKLIGSPSGLLLNRADEIHADLVVIGSSEMSRFGCFFFGSVGRALAIGSSQSFLIAKGKVAEEGKLRVVFATDHSEYADSALRLLIKLKPKGIEKLTLLTAIDKDMLFGGEESATDAFTSYMSAKSEHDVRHLQEEGITADYVVVHGECGDAVESHMKNVGADLLILGAQGHGFLERLFIGSAALQQVVATDHSILVLRPSKAS
jgi:nucleotide-binding universal stress UspA family protein